LRGLRTLDRFPPFRNMESEGKGAGGLSGLAPISVYLRIAFLKPTRYAVGI
jgi:hypothetical protein